MAITGKFVADFEDFYTGVQKADSALRTLEGSGTKLSTTFSGNMATIGKATTSTTNVFGTMREGLSQVDRTLAQFGVNLTPQVAVLGELAQVSGKTATQLGLMGTAGAVAAAALGGWQVGRWIADITGADQAIATFTASLLGLGNLAAETAAAKMDVVTLAIQRGAKETISYTEAVKFNNDWVKQHAASLVSSAGRIKEWNAEIASLGASGQLKNLRADLDGNAMSLQELADKYGVSKGAIEHWSKSIDASQASTKAAHKAIEDLTAITDKLWGKDVIDRAGDYLGALTRIGGQLPTLKSGQEELIKVFGAAITAMEQTGRTGEAMYNTLIAKQNQLLGLTKDGLIPATHLGVDLWSGPTAAVDAFTRTFLDDTYDRIEAAREETAWYTQFQQEQADLLKQNDAILAGQAAQHAETGAAGVTAARGMNEAYGQLGAVFTQVGQAFQAALPTKAVVEEWFSGMQAAGFISHGTLSGANVHTVNPSNMWQDPLPFPNRTGAPSVIVNAQNSFYDTPDSIQRLADKVGTAVMSGLRSRGAKA